MSSDILTYIEFIALSEDGPANGAPTPTLHTSRTNIDEGLKLTKGIATTFADANFHS